MHRLRKWWVRNDPNVKPTEMNERYGDHTQPKNGSEHQYPKWYGHHPHGSNDTQVHPYGEIQSHRP